MSDFLIDTHIFLWLLFSPEKISEQMLQQLADQKNQVSVSSISFWEISLKYQIGKLAMTGVLPSELPDLARQMNINIANITVEELAGFYKLPGVGDHKDPFDRLIIWQCISRGMLFVSHDRKASKYADFGLNSVVK